MFRRGSGGIAFITLMLSAAALDSDNMIIPGAGCLVSALMLFRISKRKEPVGAGSDQKK